MKQNEDMKKMTGKITPRIHPENLSFVNAHKTASYLYKMLYWMPRIFEAGSDNVTY